jgi:hypothetical protein
VEETRAVNAAEDTGRILVSALFLQEGDGEIQSETLAHVSTNFPVLFCLSVCGAVFVWSRCPWVSASRVLCKLQAIGSNCLRQTQSIATEKDFF